VQGVKAFSLCKSFEIGDSLAILKTLSWRTPLKAKRFESHDAFFASFFSKKNDERNNASFRIKGNIKN